jgi:hypothetical protein
MPNRALQAIYLFNIPLIIGHLHFMHAGGPSRVKSHPQVGQ